MTGAKPLPVIDELSRPYWDALRRRELRLPRCGGCQHLWVEPRRACPRCGSAAVEWAQMSGHGTVWSRTVFHHLYFDGFRDELPYNVVVVALDEGPRLYSNVVDAPDAAIAIGQRVAAVFEDATPEVTLLKFRLAE
jgi:uncharacterized OB-fold protein